jgi:hypothetical protein
VALLLVRQPLQDRHEDLFDVVLFVDAETAVPVDDVALLVGGDRQDRAGRHQGRFQGGVLFGGGRPGPQRLDLRRRAQVVEQGLLCLPVLPQQAAPFQMPPNRLQADVVLGCRVENLDLKKRLAVVVPWFQVSRSRSASNLQTVFHGDQQRLALAVQADDRRESVVLLAGPGRIAVTGFDQAFQAALQVAGRPPQHGSGLSAQTLYPPRYCGLGRVVK